MVWATFSITFLSFAVWLHHFFTMGAGPNVNAFFGIATMIIAVPTGVKVFNWLFTMYQGRVSYTSPMLWTIGFLITFTIGGMTGVLMSIPAVDFQLHNSVFLVAHFHNTIIGGVVFGYFAGLTYWFPKIFGFKLNEKLGKAAFWCWLIGFFVAFIPLYALGMMGMTRRLSQYDVSTGWQTLLVVSAIGALIIACGIGCQILKLFVSIKNRKKKGYIDLDGDPWDARTLEWSIPSPVPFYNFAHIPKVNGIDPYWDEKLTLDGSINTEGKQFKDIHMPKDTSIGFWISCFSLVFGFAIIWHISWLIIVSLIGVFITTCMRGFDYDRDYYVLASEVERVEKGLAARESQK